MAHISDHPAVLDFLARYWWETADLVYGEGGIAAAAGQYAEENGEEHVRRLTVDLMRLAATEFVGAPAWDSPAYARFWDHADVHRTLVADDIAIMLRTLPSGAA